MNLKLIKILLFAVCAAAFSACSGVESKNAEEVVIESSSSDSGNEVIITHSDLRDESKQIPTTQETTQPAKRILDDKSEVETLIDGFGNKTEIRYFSGHPRLRLIILRTSVDGKTEAAVYARGGETKVVAELNDKVLTASADEITRIAQLPAAPNYGKKMNYMKRGNKESSLKPLPSSAFQNPAVQNNQPVETVQSEKNSNGENPAIQQNSLNEN